MGQAAGPDRGRRAGERSRLALIFLLALLLRCVAVFRTAVIFNDGPIFIRIAELMGEGRWVEALSNAHHPLYPLLVRLAGLAAPDLESAAIGLSVLGGSLSVVALYVFLREAYEETPAWVGAILLALHPYAIRFSANVQSDSVYLALFLTAVALLYRALRWRRPGLAFATGFVSGLAYLVRPEGVGVVVVGLVLVAAAWLRRSWSLRGAGGWTAALAGGLAIPALPYLAVLRWLGGSWSISQKKSILDLLGFDVHGLEAAARNGAEGVLSSEWSLALLALLVAALLLGWRGLAPARRQVAPRARIGARALASLVTALILAACLLAPDEAVVFAAVTVSTLRPELVLLVAIGIGSRAHSGPQGRALFISAFTGIYAAVLFGLLLHYGYLSRRHALPPLCLLAGYAAMGAEQLARFARAHCARLWRGGSVAGPGSEAAWLLAVVLLVALISLPKAWHDHRVEELAGRRAAEWLREQPAGPGRIAGNKSKLGYYAAREWRPLRREGALRSLPELRNEGVRYVIVEHDALDPSVSPMGALRPGGGLALREQYRARAGDRFAVVFEIVELAR